MANREVCSFKKNAEETARVSFREFKGHRLLNPCVYVEEQAGQLIPRRGGLPLSRDFAGEFFEALRLAKEMIEGGYGGA